MDASPPSAQNRPDSGPPTLKHLRRTLSPLAFDLLHRAAFFAPSEPIPHQLLLATVVEDEQGMSTLGAAEAGLEQLLSLNYLSRIDKSLVGIDRSLAEHVLNISPDGEAARAGVHAAMIKVMRFNRAETTLDNLSMPTSHIRSVVNRILDEELLDGIQLANFWARYLRELSEYEQAKEISERALKVCEKRLDPMDIKTAHTVFGLGVAHTRLGQYQKARDTLKRCLRIREQKLTGPHADIGKSLNSLGVLLHNLGEFKAARPYLEGALAMWRRVYGDQHPRVATVMNNVGLLYVDLGLYREAEAQIEGALAIWDETLGRDHPLAAHALNNRGVLELSTGDPKVAYALIQQGLDSRIRIHGLRHILTTHSLKQMGRVLMKLGDFEQARQCFEQTLSVREQLLGASHPETAFARYELGELTLAQRDLHATRLHFFRAEADLKAAGVSPTHPNRLRIEEILSADYMTPKPYEPY